MKSSVILLSLVVLLLLAGVLPVKGGGAPGVVFGSPVFILLLALLCAGILWECRKRLRLGQAGFLLCHLGPVLVLAGGLYRHLGGERGQVIAPVNAAHAVAEMMLNEEESAALGFSVTVVDFEIERYESSYDLYRPIERGIEGVSQRDYAFVERFGVPAGDRLLLGKHGVVKRASLRDARGEWVRRHVLDDGKVLQFVPGMPRHYRATLQLRDAEGADETHALLVNHPVEFKGRRLFLMSYETQPTSYVVLDVRRDPGRMLAIPGLWMVMVGVAVVCLGRGRR